MDRLVELAERAFDRDITNNPISEEQLVNQFIDRVHGDGRKLHNFRQGLVHCNGKREYEQTPHCVIKSEISYKSERSNYRGRWDTDK